MWAKFFAIKPLLCCRDVTFAKRAALLQSTVRPVITWQSCTMTLSRRYLHALDVAQLSMLTIMGRRPRHAGELWLEWFIRTRREIWKVASELGYRPWSSDVQYSQYMWGGHVARMNCNWQASVVHRYRSLTWWRQRQDLIRILNANSLRHPGHFRCHRWENRLESLALHIERSQVAQCQYVPWYTMAQDRDLYRAQVQTFLTSVMYRH